MNTDKALVETQGEKITITADDVRRYLCPKASNQEVAIFLRTCQSMQLNPFSREVYLVKYDEKQPAATVIAIDAYLRAGESNDKYDGHEAGIILKDTTGKLEYREGSFALPEEEDESRLVGGWARVYRKDRAKPFYTAIARKEADRRMALWKSQPATMLRKTALARALREAFPGLFSGMYSSAEVEIPEETGGSEEFRSYKEVAERLTREYHQNSSYILNRLGAKKWGDLGSPQEAYEKAKEMLEEEISSPTPKPTNDQMKRFWTRVGQLGVGEEEVHRILGVSSIYDWTAQGRSLDEAYNAVAGAVKEQKAEEGQGKLFNS